MKCPKCQRQNPEDAKFCNECACSLQEIFDIGETTISIEGERKHATIMFSDISGLHEDD
jgi:uncharacterized membrane protein YvbJ